MFRSLISLLLLASLSLSPVSTAKTVDDFNMSDLLSVSSIPTKINIGSEPVIGAKSALLMDMDTGMVMYEKNGYERLPMASLTKIMTASIILEHHSLDEVVTTDDDFNDLGDLGVRMWLQKYEKITVGNLLIGLLVPSAGDAAMALAKYHSGSVSKFVEEMNARAKELNLQDTHFVNPIGIDADGHFSSAYDLAVLTKYALRNKDFRRIVQMPNATVTSVSGTIKHSFEGTNFLLGSYLNILGVKTGTTDAAGQCLINLVRNPNGKEVIVVLLNSPDRFQESKDILDWAFRNFQW
jgi:D-alanyl-D-alanine carboxypeptidase (penicillin-binding protein 5/6)